MIKWDDKKAKWYCTRCGFDFLTIGDACAHLHPRKKRESNGTSLPRKKKIGASGKKLAAMLYGRKTK